MSRPSASAAPAPAPPAAAPRPGGLTVRAAALGLASIGSAAAGAALATGPSPALAGGLVALLALLQGGLLLLVRRAERRLSDLDLARTHSEQLARRLALHDPLTGLPNRSQFVQRLAEALAQAARHGHTGAVMVLGLDRFKVVNEGLGHQAGDLLLQTVAQRLQGALRQGDQLFRLGGDEFAVLLPQVAAAEDAAVVARRLQALAAEPVAVHAHGLSVGATLGIAVFPADGRTADELLKNADAALSSAKEQARGTHAFHSPELNRRALQRLELEVALQRALREGEFTLHYQPRVAAGSREVVALEALLRWNRPRHGVVPTGEFLGALEDAGLMPVVGAWVLRHACQQVRRWADDTGARLLRVSINVSASQFRGSGFVPLVRRVLQETGAPADRIELELTESLLVAEADHAARTVDALKALGLRITIDDFGAGHSSLNHLRRFAVDGLKIDRSFGAELATSERDRALVAAIVQLARDLGITVVAKGVETEAQAAFYERIRCHQLQGWLFGRPQPVHALESHLQAQARARIDALFA